METTSRESIAHKIKKHNPDFKLDIPPISPALVEELKTFFKKNFNTKKNQLETLKRVYELADKITNEKDSYHVCRRGCAWCCAIPLEVFPIEIEYIEKHTDLKRKPKTYQKSSTPWNVGYCPLLDQETGECTVYEWRPFNCRTFVVYDSPEYCKRGFEGEEISHWTSGGPENQYGSQPMMILAQILVSLELGELVQNEKQLKFLRKRVNDTRGYF